MNAGRTEVYRSGVAFAGVFAVTFAGLVAVGGAQLRLGGDGPELGHLAGDREVADRVEVADQPHAVDHHRVLVLAEDGGVLEVSTDGGGSWEDITARGAFAEGGYNATGILPDIEIQPDV